MSKQKERTIPVISRITTADRHHRVGRTGSAIVVFVLASLLSSCAGMSSRQVVTGEAPDGVTYFMPSRDIVITLTVGKSKRDIDIGVSDVYPDLSKQYVLKFNQNWVGKNELVLAVTEDGLLTTSNAKTTSKLSEALQNLAGSLALGAKAEEEGGPSCTAVGTYTHRIDVKELSNENACDGFCKLNCTVSLIGKANETNNSKETFRSGVYYRQARPYEVEVTDDSEITIGIVSSPSGSGTRFLPITRTLFSDSSANVSFNNGMLTSHDQAADGELVALLKLPADVVGAYFTAVGNLFSKKKTALANESLYLQELRKIELSNKKTEDCLAAMADKDDDAIENFCK